MKHWWRSQGSLWILFAATACVRIGYGAIIPGLPVYAEQHGLSTLMISLMTNAYMLSNTLFQTPAGHLSDRWGRRPLILAGTALYTVAATLFMGDGGAWYYILLRGLEGLGASAFGPAIRAYVADISQPSERGKAFGMLTAFETAGLLFGPLVGGLAQGVGGPKAPFAICALLGLVAVLLLLVAKGKAAAPEVSVGQESTPAVASPGAPVTISTGRLLGSLAFWAVALPGVGMAYLNAIYSVIWGLFMLDRGATLWQLNLTYTLFAIPMVTLMVPFGALGDRWGRPLLLGLGGLGSALATLGHGLFPYPNVLMAFSAVDGTAAAMFTPANQAFMADVTPETIRGRFMGLVGSVTTGAAVVAATFLGIMYERVAPVWLFALGAVILTVASAVTVWIMVRHPAERLRHSLMQEIGAGRPPEAGAG